MGKQNNMEDIKFTKRIKLRICVCGALPAELRGHWTGNLPGYPVFRQYNIAKKVLMGYKYSVKILMVRVKTALRLSSVD